MNPFECPLQKKALKDPSSFFIQGDETYTYQEFHQYTCQIFQHLIGFKQGEMIATTATSPLFITALLLACARKKLILFILNPKLPKEEAKKRILETKASYTFSSSIDYDPSFTNPSEKTFSYDLNLPLTYLLTSGSSSTPKICVHSLKNHIYSALGSNQIVPYHAEDSWLFSLPLFHVGGLSLIFRTLLAEASLTLSKEGLEDALTKYQATHLSCVNTQLMRLLEKPSLLKALKVILLGGGPISEKIVKRASEESLPLYTTYGLTEMSSQVATSTAHENCSLLPYGELSIDSKGQILVRGETLFEGYLINGKISPHLNKKGWFETKDLGELDENGTLRVIGRTDNQFISGGENIQPEEVESFLLKHPSVTEAIVVPKDDETFGQIPLAYIKTTEETDTEELIDFLERYLPRYKIPKTFLPLHYSTLKPSRKALSYFS